MSVRATPSASAPSEPDLLEAARRGDELAFRRLVGPHRSGLHAHCYRMLASVHDAEDALQDALLRAWRGLQRFDERSSLRTWLHRIATNACLDLIRGRPTRMLPIDYGPPTEPGEQEPQEPVREPIWIEPYPAQDLEIEDARAAPDARYEQREAVELAFVAALQHLPARQRAILILRDVLGFSAREVAVLLETTVASVNSALHRARSALDERLPKRSQQATLRSLGDQRAHDLVERLANAFERGDIGAILALLADDATVAMPPYTGWCQGRDAIGDSWFMPEGPAGRLRHVPARANGQLALGVYSLDHATRGYVPICLDVLAVDGEEITEVVAYRALVEFSRFGLPKRLPLEVNADTG